MKNSSVKFYSILLFELFFLPIILLYYMIINRLSSKEYIKPKKIRKEIKDQKIYVNIHEWGGYNEKRSKKVSSIKSFDCGLFYQIQRFQTEKANLPIQLYLTMSDINKKNDFDSFKENVNVFFEVNNRGMDFSGYSSFFERIENKENSYVVLTNTSVNAVQENFLSGHIRYMEDNPEVGMLGVSYCTNIIQTFAKNNFTPHLQSFYLLTTIDVLKEVVIRNGSFPGKNINHKLLLIRQGEIKLSSIVLELGYRLAVVLENGEVYQFAKNTKYDNAYNAWKLTFGDVRLINKTPNRINPILLN